MCTMHWVVMIVVVTLFGGIKAYNPAFTAICPENLFREPGQCGGTPFPNITREIGSGYNPNTGQFHKKDFCEK